MQGAGFRVPMQEMPALQGFLPLRDVRFTLRLRTTITIPDAICAEAPSAVIIRQYGEPNDSLDPMIRCCNGWDRSLPDAPAARGGRITTAVSGVERCSGNSRNADLSPVSQGRNEGVGEHVRTRFRRERAP